MLPFIELMVCQELSIYILLCILRVILWGRNCYLELERSGSQELDESLSITEWPRVGVYCLNIGFDILPWVSSAPCIFLSVLYPDTLCIEVGVWCRWVKGKVTLRSPHLSIFLCFSPLCVCMLELWRTDIKKKERKRKSELTCKGKLLCWNLWLIHKVFLPLMDKIVICLM